MNRKPSGSLLNEDLVGTLRSLHKVFGRTPTQLSDEFKIPRTTVRDILNRRTWTHLPKGLLSWTGDHPRSPHAVVTVGCGAVYPQDDAKWCSRGLDHIGSHIWLDPRILDGEQVAWLALEMLALIDKLDPPAEEPCHTPDGAPFVKELQATLAT